MQNPSRSRSTNVLALFMFGPANGPGQLAPGLFAPARRLIPGSAFIALIVIGLIITLAWTAGLLWFACRLLLYIAS
jgi:hypothetical protein